MTSLDEVAILNSKALVEAGEFSRALEALGDAASRSPVPYQIREQAAQCLLGKGFPDMAIQELGLGLKDWPDNPWLTLGLIDVASDQGQDISRLTEQALKAIPTYQGRVADHELLYLRASVLARAERDNEARAALREALACGANESKVYAALGKLELAGDNLSAALKFLQEASAKNPRPNDLATLAFVAIQLNQHEIAKSSIDRALALAPRSAWVNLTAHVVASGFANKDLATEYIGRAGTCEYYLIRQELSDINKSYKQNILDPAMGSGCVVSLATLFATVIIAGVCIVL